MINYEIADIFFKYDGNPMIFCSSLEPESKTKYLFMVIEENSDNTMFVVCSPSPDQMQKSWNKEFDLRTMYQECVPFYIYVETYDTETYAYEMVSEIEENHLCESGVFLGDFK